MSDVIRYNVIRCREDGSVYGPIHRSTDCRKTVCGIVLGHTWYVISNDFTNECDCKKCKQTKINPDNYEP